MKTTLNLRDDLVRRAKARAALRGQPLARYVEEGLERRLIEEESRTSTIQCWLENLPEVPSEAISDLNQKIEASDFRSIDESMWR
jgi:hypothetical protein